MSRGAKKERSLTAKTLSVMILTVFSKLLGFLRTAVVAGIFGVSWQTDAFNMGVAIMGMMSGPAQSLNAVVVPMRTKLLATEGRETADRLSSGLLNLVVAVSAVLGATLFFLAPWVVRVFAPNFAGETYDLTVIVTRVFMPLLVFIGACGFYTGMLNAHKKFAFGILPTFVANTFLLLGPLLLANQFGIYAMVGGYAIGTALQAVVLVPGLMGMFRYSFNRDWNNKYILEALLLCLPVFISTLTNTINQTIDKSLASGLAEGSISALQYAAQLTALVGSVIVAPICTSIFTPLTEYVLAGNTDAMKRLLMRAINILSLLVLPITAFCLIMPSDIVYVVFQRGAFGDVANGMTSTAFMFYALGMFPFALNFALNRCFYALHDTKTPLIISAAGVAVNIALNVVLIRIMGIGGLALATSVSACVATGGYFMVLRHKVGALGLRHWAMELGKIVFALGGLVIVCRISVVVLPPIPFLMICISTFAGGAVYLLILLCLKQHDTISYLKWLRSRFTC